MFDFKMAINIVSVSQTKHTQISSPGYKRVLSPAERSELLMMEDKQM